MFPRLNAQHSQIAYVTTDLDQALAEDDSDLDEDEKKMRKLNVKDFIKKEKRLATFGETNKRESYMYTFKLACESTIHLKRLSTTGAD